MEDLSREAMECVTISDDESEINQTSAPGVVNTETREGSEVAEIPNFLFVTEKVRDLNCQGHESSIAESEVTLPQTQADNFTSRPTASVILSQKNSFQNPRKRQLRSSFGKNSLICQDRQTILCICCKLDFSCEENKLMHLRKSVSCQKFLKDHFFDSNFIEMCDNYSLTKYMCPFCLFPADKGDVFDHVLNVLKCRKDLEDAIFKYKQKAVGCEPEQQFTCNKCSHSFSTSGHLADHKRKTHREVKRRKQKNRQDGVNDLYCFKCKKFLKTETEVKDHHQLCKARLLSRAWKIRAIWSEGNFKCKNCDIDFHTISKLKEHMNTHEKGKKSPLFQFVPSVSKQDKLPPVHSSGVFTKSATAASDLHHSYALPRTNLSSTRDLDQNQRSRPQASENRLSKNTDFVCEKCSKVFYLPDMFIAHVLMHFPCLEHYEKPRNNGPDNLKYCFKCKKKLEKACTEHNCIGLVVQLFECALCTWDSPNLTNLRNHETSRHKRSVHST